MKPWELDALDGWSSRHHLQYQREEVSAERCLMCLEPMLIDSD